MKNIIIGISLVALSLSACGLKGDLMRPSDAAKKQQEKEAKAARDAQ
jgi:predicted small lipoprotein YifL